MATPMRGSLGRKTAWLFVATKWTPERRYRAARESRAGEKRPLVEGWGRFSEAPRGKLLDALGAVLLASFLTGGSASTMACSPCSVHGQAAIEFLGGETNESGTVYQTGAPDGEMLYFPEGRTYDLVHGLGVSPASVDLYVSFRRELTQTGDPEDKTAPNNVAPSAGNQAVIEVWNDRIIRVRNDTCAEFYLRAVAIADPDEVAALDSLGGAGGAAGE
jgi:hypothetical protein